MCGGQIGSGADLEISGKCYSWKWSFWGNGQGQWTEEKKSQLVKARTLMMSHGSGTLIRDGKMLVVGGRDKYGGTVGKPQLFSGISRSFQGEMQNLSLLSTFYLALLFKTDVSLLESAVCLHYITLF